MTDTNDHIRALRSRLHQWASRQGDRKRAIAHLDAIVEEIARLTKLVDSAQGYAQDFLATATRLQEQLAEIRKHMSLPDALKFEMTKAALEENDNLRQQLAADKNRIDLLIDQLEAQQSAVEDTRRLDSLAALVEVDDQHAHRCVYYYRIAIKAANGVMSLRGAIDSELRSRGQS